MRVSSTMNDATEVLQSPSFKPVVAKPFKIPDLIAAIETDFRLRAKILIELDSQAAGLSARVNLQELAIRRAWDACGIGEKP